MWGGQDSKVRAITPRDLESAQKTTGWFFLERFFSLLPEQSGVKKWVYRGVMGGHMSNVKRKTPPDLKSAKKISQKVFLNHIFNLIFEKFNFLKFLARPKISRTSGNFFSGKCKNELHILKDQRKRHRLTSVKFLKRASGLKVDITMDYMLKVFSVNLVFSLSL